MSGLLGRLSFQTKLLVAFVLVVLLTSLVGYLFINQSVSRAFSEFTVRSYTPHERGVLQLIRGFYEQTHDLDAVLRLLERSLREVPVFIVDSGGTVVYAPDERYVGRRLSADQLQEGEPLTLEGGETWTVVPSRIILGQDILEQAFLRTTRGSLWLAGDMADAVWLAPDVDYPKWEDEILRVLRPGGVCAA